MKRPRLIATDLDGTLLATDKTIPEANIAAMSHAAQLGIPFVIATGRPIRWLPNLGDIPGAHPLAIASNGGIVYDLATKRILKAQTITKAVAYEVAAALHGQIPGIAVGAESGTDFGTEPHSPPAEFTQWGGWPGEIGEILEHISPIVKLFGFHHDYDSDELAHLAKQALGTQVSVTHASMGDAHGVVEILPPGVNKAKALAELCAEMDIAASDVVVFGDMPNDLEMLRWAGSAFVPEDAHPQLRAEFAAIGSNDAGSVGEKVLELLQ